MNIALIMTAVNLGAVVANYCEVTQLHKDSNGRLQGARVKDNLTGEEWNVRAKVSNPHLSVMSNNFRMCSSGYNQRHWSVFRCTAQA